MPIENKAYYETILGVVLGTILLSFVLGLHSIAWISFGIGFIALAIPFIGSWIVRGINFIQHIIGTILNVVILGFIYYVLLTPLALIRKIFSTKSNKKANPDSHFNSIKKDFTAEDFIRPW